MIIRGIDFGHVLNSSGARGFLGEGYWFHKLVPGLNYDGSTFVSKTTTLVSRRGNMPLGRRWRPRELAPRCIVVRPRKGVVLNSVGLSGPGIEPLLHGLRLTDPGCPWMISIMSVSDSQKGRADEVLRMAEYIYSVALPNHVGIQLNLSCPNVGLDPSALLDDARAQADALAPLRRPVLLKVNALFPVSTAVEISRLPVCDGFVVSNSIPWGKLPDRIDWKGLFGSSFSPLAHLGGGGLSGRPLLPLVSEWVRSARRLGLSKAIVGGGGILSISDASQMILSGVDAVELGSVSILRPWRVSSIIRYVNQMIPRYDPRLRLAGAS